jgi:hypothetical protein
MNMKIFKAELSLQDARLSLFYEGRKAQIPVTFKNFLTYSLKFIL